MKLLVMDVEGTLFKATMKIDGTDYPSTMWQPIAYALGEAAMKKSEKPIRSGTTLSTTTTWSGSRPR